MAKDKLAVVLGIRPDVIRASLMLNELRAQTKFETVFIWSGQHYSDNLKDIFFRELGVAKPEMELGAEGSTDAEIVSQVISRVYRALDELRPKAVVFLGDTNTVMGSLAAAMLNIPIVHIEGCMRSYDWRMPEEKYRTTIDHLSDVIYAYFDEYRQQGIAEGINPNSIVVTGNPIVDVLNKYYFDRKSQYDKLIGPSFFTSRKIEAEKFYLMTCHRRENVSDERSLRAIFKLIEASPYRIFFPASYRTQKVIKELDLKIPSNTTLTDPIGYVEMLLLITNSRGVITDSGTVVEETCVLQVPSLQMRRSTERPQVYDVGSSVKFDPSSPESYPCDAVFQRLEGLFGKSWDNPLGDGKASERIVQDLMARMGRVEGFSNHRRENYHIPTDRSYRSDGLK